MDTLVIKRDQIVEEFDKHKIFCAIIAAMEKSERGVDSDLALKIANNIADKVKQNIHTDEIHNLVEYALMKSSRKDVAQVYIKYRERRNIARKARNAEVFQSIIGTENNDITRENANMNADTPSGMMMKFASEISRQFTDDYLLSEDVKTYLKNNYIWIHDRDFYPTRSLTCVQHPLDKILKYGFKAGHGETRPVKRIETAAMIACISLETAQNEMHGGQAIPAFDFYMAPYVRATYIEEIDKISNLLVDRENKKFWDELRNKKFDDYIAQPDLSISELSVYYRDGIMPERIVQVAVNNTVKRVHQAMESFVHNLNTIHSRGGNQVVFSSINYGTDTSAEGRCVIRELLKTTYDGVGNGSTAIFPIQIWKKKRGVNFNPEDRNYDLFLEACKVSGRRFFPNFLNLDASFNKSEAWKADDPKRYIHEVATMGCRTRVFENRFGPITSIGRGNLSFTTINIVKLALESKGIIDDFFEALDKTLDVVAKQLHERYEFQQAAKTKQFPFVMLKLWNGAEELNDEDNIASVLNQGTLGIGFIGLAECLIALLGKHHGESEEAQQLGLKIVSRIRDKAVEYSEKYGHNYSCLATPAEGLSGKFTLKDRQEFGCIDGVTDKDYYTNSNHVPVYYKCSPIKKAKIEAPYHDLTRGGHIFYIEADGDTTKNPDAIVDFVKVMDKYNIGYGSVNHNRNRCKDCGHEDAEKEETICPKCGSDHIDTLQRITGYLVGTTERWNAGKLAELKDRVVHTDVK